MRAFEWKKLRDSYSNMRYRCVLRGDYAQAEEYEQLLDWANAELDAAYEREYEELAAHVAAIETASVTDMAEDAVPYWADENDEYIAACSQARIDSLECA